MTGHRGRASREGENPVYGAIVAKIVIALLVFPVLVHAIFTALTMIMGPMLPTILATAQNWSEIMRKGLIGASFVIAVRSSFGVCRRLWPETQPQTN
jgi:hypothetical protein